jgi:APA family basic amino acid/polyamine antiporter
MTTGAQRLERRLTLTDAVVIGLGAMLGAGIFAAPGPAAAAAGSWLLAGLALAGVVAFANATSSAQLAALHPESGGTYVYARLRLGEYWGFLAGWSFVVGKTASLAAMALTLGSYVDDDLARPIGIGAVVALTTVNYLGVRKTALFSRIIVAVVLSALAVIVAAVVLGGAASPDHLTGDLPSGVWGVLRSGGLLFFAFAGYARLATLGEEVHEPEVTIPRVIPLALGIVVAVYAVVLGAALLAVGPAGLATSPAPLADAVEALSTQITWFEPACPGAEHVGVAGRQRGLQSRLLALYSTRTTTAPMMPEVAYVPDAEIT